MTMTVDLGPQLEKFVAELIQNGRYQSKSEVLREGVRLVQDRERRLALLEAAIARGMDDVDAGRTFDLADVAEEMRLRFGQADGVAEE
jgi:antitoxin ParD1/3/4